MSRSKDRPGGRSGRRVGTLDVRRDEGAPQQEQATASDVISVRESSERFPDEWVVMQVVERSPRYAPRRGMIVFHAASQKAAWTRVGELAREHPETSYFIYFADAEPTDGMSIREALEKVMSDDEALEKVMSDHRVAG